jgi:hypothetical protein
MSREDAKGMSGIAGWFNLYADEKSTALVEPKTVTDVKFLAVHTLPWSAFTMKLATWSKRMSRRAISKSSKPFRRITSHFALQTEFPWNRAKFSAQLHKSPSPSRDLQAWWSFFGANRCMNGRPSINFGFGFC